MAEFKSPAGYVAYDPAYPELFENEQARLRLFLNDSWSIEHIGGTAVPGLGGKPVVDLYVITPEDQMDVAYAYLMMAGYCLLVGKAAADEHSILAYTDKATMRHFHVHLNSENAQDVTDVLRLRNYLRTHPGDRDMLDTLKRRAAMNMPRRTTGTYPTIP